MVKINHTCSFCRHNSSVTSITQCLVGLLKMSQDSHSPAILPISRSFSSISLDDEAPMCRICHNAGGKQGGREPLHKVCWCRGTMGEVHKSCLELWLSAVHNDRCPVCHFHFQTNRVYKPISQVSYAFKQVVVIRSSCGVDKKELP